MQANAETLQFSRFRLEPGRRTLLAGGAPVALSSRAYDLLEFLVRNRDRVVTRDEIVAHVWRGMAVGENNLSVQMSILRRALAQHAGKEPLIVNLPGRGYRFVADVSATSPPVPPAGPPLPGRSRRTPLAAAGTAFLVLVSLSALAGLAAWQGALPAWSFLSSARVPDARLSIAVQDFVAIGRDPRTSVLAANYTQAILARFGQFGDLVLFPGFEPGASRASSHFRLTGSVQVSGDDAVIMTGLTEADTGKLLYRNNLTVPVDASIFQQSATAMQMLLDVRPSLFQAEFARRRGPVSDAVDLVVESHVAAGDSGHSSRALSLAEQAVQRSPTSVPARVLLSTLLTDRMLSLPATLGDAAGQRALRLIDGVLLEHPRNFLFIEHRAFALEALGRLDEAQATAELGLQIEPAYDSLIQTLAQVLMQKGDLARARTLIRLNPGDLGDDRIATLDFAEGRYAEALALTRRIIAAAPGDWNMQFTALLEVATLSQLGDLAAARTLLAQWLATLPEDLRHIQAQRQAFYVLPDPAWQRFKQGFSQACMPP